MSSISSIGAREILDSRGNPTIEVDLVLSDGTMGRAAVPSGASTGSREAVELRDGDAARFGGKGVRNAKNNVSEIGEALAGRSFTGQKALDDVLVKLDGTPNKSRLGANALLGVSMAYAHAFSASQRMPLYRHFGGGGAPSLPVPMFNILNGGKHAEDSTDIQEFMVVPAGVGSFSEAVRAGSEVYQALKSILASRGFNSNVGDEGGFAPSLPSNRDALEVVTAAIERAGYLPGEQCFIALDVAATELVAESGGYSLSREGVDLSSSALLDLYDQWIDAYPIVSIEDGLGEDDWDGWIEMTKRLGDRVQLVGDDLYVTNAAYVRRGIKREASNAVLIKLNQIGTVTETLEAIAIAKDASWGTVASHRSGETEDTTVADLAVGAATGQIKAGAPARGERTAKYNRLLRIEEELGDGATFAGRGAYEKYIT